MLEYFPSVTSDNEVISVSHDMSFMTFGYGLSNNSFQTIQRHISQCRLWEPYDYGNLSPCGR